MYKYKKLRGRIIEKFEIQEKFAREIEISETALSKKMQCKTGISQSDICLWSKLLEIKPEEYGLYFLFNKLNLLAKKRPGSSQSA